MPASFEFKPSTRIVDALERDPRVEKAMTELGLKCVNRRGEMCVAAEVEDLSDAARYHDVPLERILERLNGLGVEVRKDEKKGD